MPRSPSVFGRLTHLPQGATVVVVGFLPVFAIVAMFPAVPSMIGHFAQVPGAMWKVPLMVSAPGLGIALVSPVAGIVTDRLGRRTALLWATLVYGLVGVLPFFLQSLNAVFACRLALGVTEAFILTSINTLIGDYWPDAERRLWLSVQGMLGPLLAVGVILLSGAITALRWNAAFLIYLIGIPVFLAVWACIFEPQKNGATAAELTRQGQAPPFPYAAVMLTGGSTFVMALLYYVFIINGGLVFKEAGIVSSGRLSQLTALPSLFVVVGAYIFWRLRRTSNATQITVAFATLGIGLALMGALHDYRIMLVALVIQQTGAGLAVPALIAWAQTKLPFEHRGRGMGVWTMCFFIGQFASPWIVHRFDAATGSMHGAFLSTGLLGLAAAAVALIAGRLGGLVGAAGFEPTTPSPPD